MNFQMLIELIAIFLLIWMFFRWIIPMFFTKKVDTTLEKKKELLRESTAELHNLEKEVDVTSELKTVITQKKKTFLFLLRLCKHL